PTGACYKDDEDGVIKIDRDICVGCQSCMRACPYEANIFNKELHVMDKCDVCSARRAEGLPPACVRNCAGGALHYGDINDPESEVSKLIKENEGHVYALKDVKDCHPSARYILKNCDWIEDLPFDFAKKIRGEQ
ncbi:MAG: 4Fe-4S dicluster domain-containing protein, partial [Parasporobacterium sp.]|nr:4Fe-4S dicluster domain-containing protein [Parasporobacterium sp.]